MFIHNGSCILKFYFFKSHKSNRGSFQSFHQYDSDFKHHKAMKHCYVYIFQGKFGVEEMYVLNKSGTSIK